MPNSSIYTEHTNKHSIFSIQYTINMYGNIIKTFYVQERVHVRHIPL